ncbi:permease-like cell division protein FtsX [Marinobacter xestospongiae]|uniref:permease-like cell division protein FtsX n=1 Tax=Marinobacter xestospongiae TaxID=994319 RepID=UPI002004CA08|nr:permease-like cell division protein FtsX [Marinobacter xestospongiae]MCK7568694.1 permease-like cell division protein FtsX [Marinobacter xestospongiae]
MATESRRSRPERGRGAARSRSESRSAAESYFAHHRKVASDSARRLLRTPVASLMTWLVMGVALALPVGLLLLLGSLQGVSAGWESSARLTAYLEDGLSLAQAEQLQLEVGSRGDVDDVELIGREQALAEFRDSSGLSDALDYLDTNPLPHTLLVTPPESDRTAAGVERLAAELKALAGVAQVQVDLGWLQRLNGMTELLARGVWVLAMLLGAAVVLVIGNTIRLAIENRRDEILVAKLVGGTDAFVRRPFLYTGVWFGLGGGLVAWVLLQLSLWWLSGPIERLAGLYRSNFELTGLSFEGALGLLLVAMVLGWLGAWVAVKRHLDAIEPGMPSGAG